VNNVIQPDSSIHPIPLEEPMVKYGSAVRAEGDEVVVAFPLVSFVA
jgi:hypothetical protein